jgi:hypothetical protein
LQEAGLTERSGEYTTKEVMSAFYPDVKVKRAELLELQKPEQQMRVSQLGGV